MRQVKEPSSNVRMSNMSDIWQTRAWSTCHWPTHWTIGAVSNATDWLTNNSNPLWFWVWPAMVSGLNQQTSGWEYEHHTLHNDTQSAVCFPYLWLLLVFFTLSSKCNHLLPCWLHLMTCKDHLCPRTPTSIKQHAKSIYIASTPTRCVCLGLYNNPICNIKVV